jgi:hypothetical protein
MSKYKFPQEPVPMISTEDEICGHLAPLLQAAVDQGMSVREKNFKKWPHCKLEINLEGQGFSKLVKSFGVLPDFIEYWEFNDPQMAERSCGVSCDICQHTVSASKANFEGVDFTVLD